MRVYFTSNLSNPQFSAANGSGLGMSYTSPNPYLTLMGNGYSFTNGQIIGYLTFYYSYCSTETISFDNVNGGGGYCEYADNYGDPLYDNNGYTSPYYVNGTISCNTSSTAATAATATPNPICSGSCTTLGITGGSLGTSSNWEWYSGSCGGTYVKSGTSPQVCPTTTTTYYVRAEGPCNSTTCVSITVTVNTLSTAATSASASPSTICSGSSSTLSFTGGSLGTGASWQWSTGSCGGTNVGNGTTITVSPTVTTMYYVRAEGTCNTTTCATVTVIVNTLSSDATTASASPNPICNGSSTTLTETGGNLGTGATWHWWTGSCNGTLVGSTYNTTYVITPTTSTTYYVNAVGTCNTTSCVTVRVIVHNILSAPSSASASPTAICPGATSTLTVSGSLGTGGYWKWFTGSCGGTIIKSTNSSTYVVSPTVTTTYWVRGQNTCNTTTCVSVTVTVNTLSTAATSASANPNPVCGPIDVLLQTSGGSLGTGASWNWWTGSCNGAFVDNISPVYINLTTTTTYYVNAVGTCNTTTCVSVIVEYFPLSVAPTTLTPNPATICPGQSVTLTESGGSLSSYPGTDWHWYSGSCGGTYIRSTYTTTTVVSPTVTTYYCVRAEGYCGTTTCACVEVVVQSCKGANDNSSNENISIENTDNSINNMLIYPNPANDIVNIDYNITSDGLVTISLYNVLGEKVMDIVNENQQKGSHNSSIDIKSIPDGVYTIKITTGNNNTIVKRIVINK